MVASQLVRRLSAALAAVFTACLMARPRRARSGGLDPGRKPREPLVVGGLPEIGAIPASQHDRHGDHAEKRGSRLFLEDRLRRAVRAVFARGPARPSARAWAAP